DVVEGARGIPTRPIQRHLDEAPGFEAAEGPVRLDAVHAAHAGDFPRGRRPGPRQVHEHEGFIPAETHPLKGFRGLGQFHLPEDVNAALLTPMLHAGPVDGEVLLLARTGVFASDAYIRSRAGR